MLQVRSKQLDGPIECRYETMAAEVQAKDAPTAPWTRFGSVSFIRATIQDG